MQDITSTFNSGKPDTFKQTRVSWLVYAIAAIGLLINAVYFGTEFAFSGVSLSSHLSHNLFEHLFILAQIVIFPLIAYLAHRVIVGRQLDEYSRRLELEVAAFTRELEDLKSFSENIMASVNDLIFVIGTDGRFQFFGGNSEKVLGYAPERLIGRQFVDLAAPGAVAHAISNFEKIMRGEEVVPYELDVLDGNGEPKCIEVSSTPYWESGRVIAQVGVAREVTERKKLEEHVFERNRELAALNAVAAAVGRSLDLEQILSAALDQVVELFTAHRACVHLSDPQTRELNLKVWKGGSPVFLEAVRTLKPGEGLVGKVARQGFAEALNVDMIPPQTAAAVEAEGLASVAAIPIKSRGRLLGVLSVGSEQTGRFSPTDLDLLGALASQVAMALENALLFGDLKNKTEELARRNDELAGATEKISTLITAAEREKSFSVRYENPFLAKCWEVKGCTYVDCPSYQSHNLRCWQVAGTHCGGEVQGLFAQKVGQCEKCEVYQLSRVDLLTGLGEDFNNMMAMLEQKAEEQRQLQEQLIQSTKLAAIGELAANIAHEINNPLTGVLGCASLLLREMPEKDPRTRNIRIIETETLRARDIVRNLLDFSRQDGLKRRKMSIKEVMENTLRLLRKQAELSNVKVELDLSKDVPYVNVDPNQMKQVFINVLNNALHAMPEGGRLRIGIQAVKPDGRPPWVEVAFTDTGMGIPAEKIDRVFDPFYTTKDIGEGTGLGLSVSQRIVEEHGGSMEVRSQVGAGSTFTVKLPTASVAAGFKNVA